MKIRIISGRYGMRTGASSVIVKTPHDPPFEILDAEGARLIELGVAAPVLKDSGKDPIPVPKDPTPRETAGEKSKKKAAAKKKVDA